MMERGVNSPLSSSCGRLFDAVAAALGLSRDGVSYEGQAAIELETLAAAAMPGCGPGYPFAVDSDRGGLILDPAPMWTALLLDLDQGEQAWTISARFHAGLAEAVAGVAASLADRYGIGAVALSGGVFQNATLLEGVGARLRSAGLRVLHHEQVPANDGGISLGQAAVAAARIAMCESRRNR
jgi:hydrogenase maturation protein HypF